MSNLLRHISHGLIWTTGVIALSASYFFRDIAKSQAPNSDLTQVNYVKTYYDTVRKNGGIPSKLANRKGLIDVYCRTILDANMVAGFKAIDKQGNSYQKKNYSPKDSLFVFLLCNSLNGSTSATDYIPDSIKKDLINQLKSEIQILTQAIEEAKDDSTKKELQGKRDRSIIDLNNEVQYSDLSDSNSSFAGSQGNILKHKDIKSLVSSSNCNRSSDLNSCPISTYISKLFHLIINDYTNSKVAGIYGSMSTLSQTTEVNDESIKQSITNFSNYYYAKCGALTGGSEHLYINKDQIEGSDKNYCSHPNTYKVLANFIENSYQKTKKNKIIDFDKLLDKESTKTFLKDALATPCNEAGGSSLDCALGNYKHLVLNELLYYGMFMEFYSHYVVSSEQFGPLTIGKDKTVTQEILDEEGRKAQIELEVASNAVEQDMKILRNLFAKFPIHIALVAYLEDLVNFRNELVKLYTPIHQMYYKMRNAQTYER